MNPDQHRAVVEDYYRAMREGDFDHVVELHDEDVVCWMSGRSIVSGRFRGRANLYAHMGEHVLGPLLFGAEPYVKNARIAIVDGDIAVGLLHGGLPASDGGRYNQFYLQIFRFENGKIREIVELFDTVMVETVLVKNRLQTPREAPPCPFTIDPPALRPTTSRSAMADLAASFAGALADGGPDKARDLLAQGAELRVIGSTPLSGTTRDPRILDSLFASGLDGVRIIAADRNAAVVLARSGDPNYLQQYGLLIEADGDAIGCVSVFFDTAEAEAHEFDNFLRPGASAGIMPQFDIGQAMSGR